MTLAFCLAHARRKFFEVHKTTDCPVAWQALQNIAEIYRIEKQVCGASPEVRVAIR